MARLFLIAAAIGILWFNGGGWRIAGLVLIAALVVVAILLRLFGRRMAHAREPDPQSTLKL